MLILSEFIIKGQRDTNALCRDVAEDQVSKPAQIHQPSIGDEQVFEVRVFQSLLE